MNYEGIYQNLKQNSIGKLKKAPYSPIKEDIQFSKTKAISLLSLITIKEILVKPEEDLCK